jgi:hypothetical protein
MDAISGYILDGGKTDLELELSVLEFTEDPDLEWLLSQRERLQDARCVSLEARARRDETLAVVDRWIGVLGERDEGAHEAALTAGASRAAAAADGGASRSPSSRGAS